MVARDPKRPKAAHLDQHEVLSAVYECAAHGVHPADFFPSVPGKVVIARLRKLQNQGLIAVGQHGYVLTEQGKEALLS